MVVVLGGCAADDTSDTGAASTSADSGASTSASSSGADSSSGSSPDTDTSGEPVDVACTDEVEILQFDGVTPSGFRRCSDGFVHLAASQTCLVPEAPAACSSDEGDMCTTSAECTERPHGACLDDPSVLVGCGCVYGCETNADCGGDEVCACTGVVDWPVCIPAGCTDAASCGDAAALCGLGTKAHQCGNVDVELACLTAISECRSECAPAINCYDDEVVPSCEIVEGAWACDLALTCEDCG